MKFQRPNSKWLDVGDYIDHDGDLEFEVDTDVGTTSVWIACEHVEALITHLQSVLAKHTEADRLQKKRE